MSKKSKILLTLDIIDVIDKICDSDDDDDSKLLESTIEYISRKRPKTNASSSETKINNLEMDTYQLKDVSNPIEFLTEKEFYKIYKFSKETVIDILDMISYGLTKTTNRGNPNPPIIELLITLRFLTTGNQITSAYNVSQPTVSRIIKKISSLLSELKLRFIKFPDRTESKNIFEKFFKFGGFPEVFGCLGSTHIGIKCPAKTIADDYLNDKGYYSLNCQIICGPNYEFYDFVSRWPGAMQNNKIFNMSEARQKFEYLKLDGVLLASNNYYPCGFVMTPIHELMLLDKPRLDAYRNSIMKNKDKFKDKIVLDVGAGTGILSIFCAQAGAKKVYAIEASNLAILAKNIVKENNFENIIEVHRIMIEDFKIPDDKINKVDIIVSEWMGFYLLHEGMLDSIVYARDKFLKSDGLMIPDSASIYVASCSIPSRFDNWENVSGVKMLSFANQLRLQKSQSAEVMKVEQSHLLQDGVVMAWLDLKEISLEDLEEFSFKEVTIIEKAGKYQGVCIWFECNMINDDDIVLSTSPKSPETHWKQTVLIFPNSDCCQDVEPGEPVAFNLIIKRQPDNLRRYDLQLTMIEQNDIDHPLPCNCYMTKCILAKAYINSTVDAIETTEED